MVHCKYIVKTVVKISVQYIRELTKYVVFILKCVVFYTRQLYRQILLRAHISYGNSVRLSGVSRPGTESSPGEIETPGSLVSNEVIWCR